MEFSGWKQNELLIGALSLGEPGSQGEHFGGLVFGGGAPAGGEFLGA